MWSPPGTIIGPLLFSIFICDMFYFLEGLDIANYADDTTTLSAKIDHNPVIKELEMSSSILMNNDEYIY